MLASGSSDWTINIWNVKDGSEITTLQGHFGMVTSVNFCPKGEILLASGSYDGTIRFWPERTQNVSRWVSHWYEADSKVGLDKIDDPYKDTYKDTYFSEEKTPDGPTLVPGGIKLDLGDKNKTVRGWSLELNNLLREACKWLHGYLKNNPNVSKEDCGLCDDILQAAKDLKEP
jgi:WD40 repeat protein